MPVHSAFRYLRPLPLAAAALLGLPIDRTQFDSITPRWSAAVDLRIPSIGDQHLLTQVFDLQVGSAGEIIVGDAQEARLFVFNAAGRLLRFLGKRGYGPGEFQTPKAMGWLGDTLWVTDEAQLRVSFFDLERATLGSARISGPAIPPGLPRPPNHFLSDGSVVLEPQVGSQELVKTRAITEIPVWRLTRQGVILDTLARLPIGYRVVYLPIGPRELYSSHPLPMVPLWKAASAGQFLVFVDLPIVRNAERGAIRIHYRKPNGEPLRTVHLPFDPQELPTTVTDSILESIANGLSKALPERPAASTLRSILRQRITFPQFRPPVTRLVIGKDSTVWLRREETGAPTTRWDVLDWSGTHIASCELPADLVVFQAQRTALWGVMPDKDGAPQVLRYHLSPESEENR